MITRLEILNSKGYWTEMLESASYNNWTDEQIADEIIKGIKEVEGIVCDESKCFCKCSCDEPKIYYCKIQHIHVCEICQKEYIK